MSVHPSYLTNNTSKDCWHCSLVSYEVPYLTSDKMHYFAGYILPGLIFCILGLRWTTQLVFEWTRVMLTQFFESNGLPATPSSKLKGAGPQSGAGCLFSLPWEGIVKVRT